MTLARRLLPLADPPQTPASIATSDNVPDNGRTTRYARPMRVLLVVAVVACAVGCVHRRIYDPPARLTLGPTVRHFSATPAKDTANTFRTTTPDKALPTIPEQEAKLGSLAFTMASRSGLYGGGEVETGVLGEPGSSAAGVYGILGMRKALVGANLAVEVAAGQRWLRYGIDGQDQSKLVAEPRLRADFWLGEQFSFGAAAGITLDDQTVWMAGVFLGIHSHAFGRK
jgi:hypothetical protein